MNTAMDTSSLHTGVWSKKGLLLDTPGPASVVKTHVALPSVDESKDGSRFLYYSGRDSSGRAHICRAPLYVNNDHSLSVGDSELSLAPGGPGTFDEAGCTHSCVVDHDGAKYLYYSGWTLGQSVPFYFYAGLAISSDGGKTYERASLSPILERNRFDPFLTASPSVIVEDGLWRMWYVCGAGWQDDGFGSVRHLYHLRYCESHDGITWDRSGQVAIDFSGPHEYAIGRPSVVRSERGYEMWFCARGERYEIIHAVSSDGLTWERTGTPQGLAVSGEGWDSDMACYPSVFDAGDQRYLLYNGNDYGKSGAGYALEIRA